jgi:hypothetical protein
VARALEMELTDSCTRHGSLYDRAYRVQLRRSEDPGAPLFAVSSHAGQELAQEPAAEPAAEPAPGGAPGTGGTGEEGRTEAAPYPCRSPTRTPPASTGRAAGGWQPGRWILVVEDEEGEESEAFRLTEPLHHRGPAQRRPAAATTHRAQRRAAREPPPARPALGGARRRAGVPGLQPGAERAPPAEPRLPGAHVGRGPAAPRSGRRRATRLARARRARCASATSGPTLRVEEVPQEEDEDPEATRFE